MSGNLTITTTNSVTYQGPAKIAPAPASHDLTFGEILSDLNPLQYLPVIGTIYRSITGDVIPKSLREAGSVAVSGLLGGPIGIATNLTVLALEKLTGIDLEDLEQGVLAQLGVAKTVATDAVVPGPTDGGQRQALSSAEPAIAPAGGADVAAPRIEGGAWTASQLAAYGVTTLKNGTVQRNGVMGADVLNDLQLQETAGTRAAALAS